MTLAELQSKTKFLLFRDTTSTIYSDANILSSLNQYYQELTGIILGVMGEWEMKSTYATKNLTADENEYLLPLDLIALERVEINYTGKTGDEKVMKIVDMRQIKEALTDTDSIYTVDNPYVRVFDFSIFIHPTPTANITNGLKIYFSQEQTELSESTDEPSNLPKLAQMYLVYGACLDFAIAGENMNRITILRNQLAEKKQEIIDYYASRLPAKDLRLNAIEEDNNY